MTYPVVEIFPSIQGEGFHMGEPKVFIRLAGCNLRCTWCDTQYDYDTSTEMSIDQILDRLQFPDTINLDRIVITGGEPTIHSLVPLIEALHITAHKHVSIETNGTRAIPRVSFIGSPDWVTCSPKPPDYRILCQPDELKYVVDDQFDLKYVDYGLVLPGRIFLQVESTRPESAQRAYDMAMISGCRVGVQLHKVLAVR